MQILALRILHSSTYRNSSWQSEASSFSAFVESESISIPQSGKKLKSQMS